MATEYHQLPSQQGLLPVELITETDPWLLAATSNLSISGWNTKNKRHSPPSLFGPDDVETSFQWKSIVPEKQLLSVKPREFISTSSKIDAWTVQPQQQQQQQEQVINELEQQQQVNEVDAQQQKVTIEDELASQNRYKTELCKSFTETGVCRYGNKCQFAHGKEELRPILRHPKYKTETCKTFYTTGSCPYGIRCRFIHTKPKDDVVATLPFTTAAVVASLMSGNPNGSVLLGKKNSNVSAPPPGIPVPQWSKSWTAPAQKSDKKIRKQGFEKIDLVEPDPEF